MTKAIIFGSVFLLIGCADPTAHMDGIWPTAGYAQRKNLSSQAIGYSGQGSRPGGDGVRASEVIRQYQRRGQPESQAAPAVTGAASPSAAAAAAGFAAEAAGLGQ